MLKKRSILLLAMLLLISTVLMACGGNNAGNSGESGMKESAVRIGTSSSGSPFYAIAVGIAEMVNKHAEGLNATAEAVGGSDPNIFALEAEKIEMAVANALAAYNGYNAKESFEKKVKIGLVAQGQSTFRQILVRKDAGINSISDLVGKKVINKRPALPEIEAISKALFEVYGLDESKVQQISTVDTKEAIEALKLGSVDAIFLPASLKAANIAELFSDDHFAFLSVDEDKIEAVLALLPTAIDKGIIPANTYPNQDKAIVAFKFNTYLVARENLSEEAVYRVTKALYENFEEFSTIHNAAKSWKIETTLSGPTIPYHPGAIKYFKEKGLWSEDLAKLNDSLKN